VIRAEAEWVHTATSSRVITGSRWRVLWVVEGLDLPLQYKRTVRQANEAVAFLPVLVGGPIYRLRVGLKAMLVTRPVAAINH